MAIEHKVHPMKSYRDGLSLIRVVPDFPKSGILFQDITPLLADGEAFSAVIAEIASRSSEADYVAGVEARGFIFAAAIALKLDLGFIPIRKSGKLPSDSISRSYGLEYGESVIEIHRDSFPSGSKIFLIDDILATGGTMCASIDLIHDLGGEITDIAFVSEIPELGGRARILEKNPSLQIHILTRS